MPFTSCGRPGWDLKPHSAFLSPSPACPREGKSLCKHTALTGDICPSRSYNFFKAAEASGEWEWQMRTLPSMSQQWLCEVLWDVTAPGRAAGKAGSIPCGHSSPADLSGKQRRKAEPAPVLVSCQHLPRAEAAQMLLVEGICFGRAQRSCAGSQHPLSLSGRLGWRK